MATDEQRARRRAQRETAQRLKPEKYIPVLPRSTRAPTRAARERYAYDVIAGREPFPPKGSREGNNLASLASKARHGKADPKFEAAFSRYWYHKNDEKNEADLEDENREGASDGADNEEE